MIATILSFVAIGLFIGLWNELCEQRRLSKMAKKAATSPKTSHEVPL